MNKAQRIVAIAYCLLVVYCCVWVPWHFAPPDGIQARAGYGWLWAGPMPPVPDAPEYSDLPPGSKILRPTSDANGPLATPDWAVVSLRLLAITALGAAGFLAAMRN